MKNCFMEWYGGVVFGGEFPRTFALYDQFLIHVLLLFLKVQWFYTWRYVYVYNSLNIEELRRLLLSVNVLAVEDLHQLQKLCLEKARLAKELHFKCLNKRRVWVQVRGRGRDIFALP